MPRRTDHFPPRHHSIVSVHQQPPIRFLERAKIVWNIAATVALSRILRVLKFLTLHNILGVGKSGYSFPILVPGVPTAVVKMQMRVDDNVYLFGPNTSCKKFVWQARRVLKRIDIVPLGVPFIPRSSFTQDPL